MSQRDSRINIPLFVLSLSLAIFLWAVVYTQTTPINNKRLDIAVDIVPPDPTKLAVVSADRTLRVDITGTAEQIKRLMDSSPRVQVDLSRGVPGKRKYRAILSPSLFKDLANDPEPMVEITLEGVKVRRIPVKVIPRGNLSDPSLVMPDMVVNPQSVSVRATLTDQERIAGAQAEFDLSQIDPNKPEPTTVEVRLVDERGRPISEDSVQRPEITPPTVDITPILSPASVRKTAFVNVIFKGSPAAGYVDAGFSVVPNRVTIAGTPEVMNRVSQVDTEPIDLSTFAGERTVQVQLRLPRGVASSTPAKVKVHVMVRPVGDSATGNGATP